MGTRDTRAHEAAISSHGGGTGYCTEEFDIYLSPSRRIQKSTYKQDATTSTSPLVYSLPFVITKSLPLKLNSAAIHALK
jgi:hypothetical protein